MTTYVTVNNHRYVDIERTVTVSSTQSTLYFLYMVGATLPSLTVESVTLSFGGTDFVYSGEVLTGGTITSVFYMGTGFGVHGGQEITGLSLPAADVMALYQAGNWVGLRTLLFADDVVFLGGAGNDIFRAGGGSDALMGAVGNDTLVSNEGEDYLNGGIGDDVLIAGAGADLIFGDEGNDIAWAGADGDILLMGSGNDTVLGEAGADIVYGEAGNDALLGGAQGDFLVGGDGNDSLWGEGDGDYLMGEAGDDQLFGGSGDDTLVGGNGNDVLFGDAGVDALFLQSGHTYADGGAGGDYFYALQNGAMSGGQDVISNFETGQNGAWDFLVLPSAYQSATTFFDQGGYAWVATPVSGGVHYITVVGATAAGLAAQTVWL